MPMSYESISAATLNEATLFLLSGRAEYFLTISETARYLASRNERFVSIKDTSATLLRMVFRQERGSLAESVDGILHAMVDDGTMEALYQAHVANVIDGNDAIVADLPTYEDAETILIGISGDMPPVDYTTPEGSPAGYNTAVAAELSKRLEMNVEFVTVESNARFMALQSGAIDMFFWEMIPVIAEDMIQETEQIMNIHLSEPYLETTMGWLTLATDTE